MPGFETRKIFSLEMTKDNGQLKISAHEKSSDDEKTIRRYEYKKIIDDEIKKICNSVVNLFNRANLNGKIDRKTLRELQTAGQLLYDNLLTGLVKEKLSNSVTENLIVSIDDRLVHIPWELMFDGKEFLCQKFNMGRLVSTSQRISEPSIRKVEKPIKMLVVADPKGDLEASYSEGVKLRDELDSNHDIIQVHLKSSHVDVNSVKGVLRDFDIIHYAGHADYDTVNPSDSGFLMGDGKLKAADIINMIGLSPLPSLVFSNACKSGHTEIWTVNENYESEIYGLANAFLLAGVQHYIGTFWDIQDEPSRYFALDFYKSLMKGTTVGEAIRRARLKLIERYGEDTIIWASYMLYGDPTARYADLTTQAGNDEEAPAKKNHTFNTDETLVVGSTRGNEHILSFPSNKRSFVFTSFVFLFLVAVLIMFFIFKTEKNPLQDQRSVSIAQESKEEKEKRIDKLVSELIMNYEKQRSTGKVNSSAKSGPLTMVFMNINANGISEMEKEFILSQVTDTLHTSGRVQLVERDVLDKLLEELRLSSTELAKTDTALRVGNILSAQLISIGNISKNGKDWRVSMRLIESETTSIKAAISTSLHTHVQDDVADRIGQEILIKLKAAYPLKGKILSMESDIALLDLGIEDGAVSGMKVKVLTGEKGLNVGELEITSVEESRSKARVISEDESLKAGYHVEELT